mmetsp:Transcript_8695/g.7149  ORF Transcript_8695/g.7149 Transcript_8695/m.7149 type:complete len:87 (+) Transcript_8695:265-525(+)
MQTIMGPTARVIPPSNREEAGGPSVVPAPRRKKVVKNTSESPLARANKLKQKYMAKKSIGSYGADDGSVSESSVTYNFGEGEAQYA